MKLLSFYRSIVIYTVLLGVINAQAETLDANLKTLQSVGKEGLGNSAATVAWQEVASVDAELIPTILSSIDGDNPLSANWIRAAVDAIASRHEKLPLNDLEVFLADVRHDGKCYYFQLLSKDNYTRMHCRDKMTSCTPTIPECTAGIR